MVAGAAFLTRLRLLIGCVAVAFPILGAGCGPPATPRGLVLVSLDTVRRDHLPTYGYPRTTAPRLDALARESVVFENAFAQHVNTGPSHASIFTGLYPHAHGSVFNGSRLPEGHLTLAQLLARTGFRTAAFVSAATMKSGVAGLDRGFEHYDDDFEGGRRTGRETVRRARGWLETLAPDAAFFLFVHLYDAHGPYHPKGSYAHLFQSPEPGPVLDNIPPYQRLEDAAGHPLVHLNRYVDRYDALLRVVDDRLGELLLGIDTERVVVVVLADHGETLGERYRPLDHGGQVFDEQIRIPLVVRTPAHGPGRVDALVETVDLLPTLLELLGVASPAGLAIQGRSLVPLLGEQGGDAAREVFSSARALSKRHRDRGYELEPSGQIHTLRGERWKLVLYPGAERDYLELYDLSADPGERRNLADSEPAERDAQLARLRRWMALGSAAEPPAELAPALRQHLLDLGYAVPD